jgi:membrane-bound serine protease (ClpP class)
MVKRIIGSKVPVITFVHPGGSRAASAGVFITIASHIAAMSPSTNIGAAHVVNMSGSWPGRKKDGGTTGILPNIPALPEPPVGGDQDVMSEKVMNDTLAWAKGIAQLRGRNAEWVKQAIEKSVSVTADEALKLGVIDLLAEDLPDLIKKSDGRRVRLEHQEVVLRIAGAQPEQLELTSRQRILNALASPNVALMLLLIGFAGLMYEITHPGILVPGVVGAICLLLAALALNMLPTNYAAILLIIAGIVLIVAEIKFVSYGLLTLGGAVCLFFGALALFDQPYPFVGVSVSVALMLVGTTVALLGLLVILVIRAHGRKPVMGEVGFIGEIAEARTEIAPEGKVFFNGSYWDAVSEKPIPAGARVRIVAMDRLQLRVEPV